MNQSITKGDYMYKNQVPAEVLARRTGVGVNAIKGSMQHRPQVGSHGSSDRNKPDRERFEKDRQAVPRPCRMTQFPSKSTG